MARPLAATVLPLAVVLALTACGGSSPSATDMDTTGTVVRTVDGDTLIVRTAGGDTERVRLLGIDTPESVQPETPPECGSRQAAASLARLATGGTEVVVTTDAASGDVRDMYGRLLAFVSAHGRDLGLAQLRRGWAEVYAYRDRRFARRARYERALDDADDRAVGVHGLCDSDFHSGR